MTGQKDRRSRVESVSGGPAQWALDSIDALTAKLAEAEVERDALLDALRMVKADRPSVHSDEVWEAVNRHV